MSVQYSDVMKIAELAKLAIPAAEVDNYARELSNILQLVEQMNQADTSGISPTAHSMEEGGLRLRPDVVTEQDDHKILMAGAPAKEADLFLVPKVVE